MLIFLVYSIKPDDRSIPKRRFSLKTSFFWKKGVTPFLYSLNYNKTRLFMSKISIRYMLITAGERGRTSSTFASVAVSDCVDQTRRIGRKYSRFLGTLI